MRARNIKPGYFRNAQLLRCSLAARLAFAGLWLMADRLGRLLDRPDQVHLEVFGLDPAIDPDAALWELAEAGFIVRYTVGALQLLAVLKFTEHQNPHRNERASQLPGPTAEGAQLRARMTDLSSPTSAGAPAPVRLAASGQQWTDGATVAGDATESGPGLDQAAPAFEAPALVQGGQAEFPGFGLVALPRPEVATSVLRQRPRTAPPRRARPRPPDCPHECITALWRLVLPGLPAPPEPWVGAARTHLRARWREQAMHRGWVHQGEGLDYFRKLFEHVARSRFLTGRVGPRRLNASVFEASLEWLVKLEPWQKVHSGYYHDEVAAQ